MLRATLWSLVSLALLLAFSSVEVEATTVRQLNLAEMTDKAGSIFRGRLAGSAAGSVEVGGTTLPTVTYRFELEEAFQGSFSSQKGIAFAEITMIGKVNPREVGSSRLFSIMPEMPDLKVGRSYLLFATQPSAVGLSTTVGLGQGCFQLSGIGKKTMAANDLDNRGLFRGMSTEGIPAAGPIPYSDLARRIRRLLGQ